MTRIDPALQAHKDWTGFVQPVGLVVSPRALIDAQAQIDVRAAMGPQQVLLSLTGEDHVRIADLHRLTTEVLGWRETDLVSGTDLEHLSVVLPELGDTLAPTYAVRDAEHSDHWLLLVVETAAGDDLDDDGTNALRGWTASHQARFERLLRERDVPIGILTNREVIRLVYSPRGESTGHVTFVVREMAEVPGRPILAALLMLLGEQRLFAEASNRNLPALLRQSRKYQNEVSERLAGQVLESLWRLLYGFQAADEFSGGELLRDVLRRAPNNVYGGLLATIMRMVFTLYAEDRALLPTDSQVYAANYGLLGLFERLREDNARFPDTMTQRFGAWTQLLTLFRLLHDGASHGTFRLPPRHGRLFDPNAYPFLEGRQSGSRSEQAVPLRDVIADRDALPTESLLPAARGRRCRKADEGALANTTINIPRISDAIVYGILDKLLYLDGDRLSYAALDVEEIGSVYEAMMGFQLEVTSGRSIGVKPKTKKGVRADVIVDLEKLLAAKPQDRAKLLKEEASAEVTGKSVEGLMSATTPEQIVEAFGNRVSPFTPRILPRGTMALQPSEERRRSGSHYTPRSLTQPIVKTTLQPILDQLCGDPQCAAFEARNDPNRRDPVPACIAGDGEHPKHRHPRPEQILDLKVCDPAMGSGAFLVEACRFLGDALVRAWQIHGGVPPIPPDEDIVLYARRRIAQQCLYGVDRNPFAVDLAKLSLWLATLAKDHPFTFLDHALRHGDSLVGLSRDQIVYFDWEESDQLVLELSDALKSALVEAEAKRDRIHELGDSDDTDEKQRLLAEAEAATRLVRTAGDLLIAAFFGAEKDRDRKALRASTLDSLRNAIRSGSLIDDAARELRGGAKPLPPFHWFLEFPEVFSRPNSGFDAFIGNPPFAGKNTLILANRDGYADWLKEAVSPESSRSADLVAYFFIRCYQMLRWGGCFGLVATNTVSEGDTRRSGLGLIRDRSGTIYSAKKSFKWPGSAAVTVSIVHVSKSSISSSLSLNDRPVSRITRFLFHTGPDKEPTPLAQNARVSFKGCELGSLHFLLGAGKPTPVELLGSEVLLKNYVGGEDITQSADPLRSSRRVVDVDLLTAAQMSNRPGLEAWLATRLGQNRASKQEWWHFRRPSIEFRKYAESHSEMLAISEVTTHMAFTKLPTSIVPSHKLKLFGVEGYASFACLQSRIHEVWVQLLTSTREARLNYSPTDCFLNFAFPAGSDGLSDLETAGKRYYEHRFSVMAGTGDGLTDTYNRFHDPGESHPDILKLRELHDAMDRAVLDAYGWTDIQPRCEFILDYVDEEEGESTSRRKKPWRYRWPEDIRDEALARLLALNVERAKQELTTSVAVVKPASKRTKPQRTVPLFEPGANVSRPAMPFEFAAVSALPNGAWARPNTDQQSEEMALLAAILKSNGTPAPIRDVSLAQILGMEPALLTPLLDPTESAEWVRLVGEEAIPRSGTARQDRSSGSSGWGRALRQLRGTGLLVPAAGTWGPGHGLDVLSTAGWPEGRAGFVLDVLRSRNRKDLIASLPLPEQEWINGLAA